MNQENDPVLAFQAQVGTNIAGLGADRELLALTHDWVRHSNRHGYTYNFSWLGRPIIQYPQDMVAIQELVYAVKPDLIIETGVAHGGSLVLSASLLALLDVSDAIEAGKTIDPRVSSRKVVGVDIDIRAHNRAAIEKHPMSSRIQLIQGSSIDAGVIQRVKDAARGYERVMVFLDSNHTHDHVLAELEAYASLTSKGSYCVVFDTLIEDMPKELFPDRPWGPGDNPKTAVHQFLKSHPEFEIDRAVADKLQITVAPDGFLRRKP